MHLRALKWAMVMVLVLSQGCGVFDFSAHRGKKYQTKDWIVDSPSCLPLVLPKSNRSMITVSSGDVLSLMRHVKAAFPGTVILLEDGLYFLPFNRSLLVNVPELTIRGASGNREAVRLEGGSNAITVNADGFTIADLTIQAPRFHAIQVRGERGVSQTHIYNVHLLVAGQQFIKVSAGDGTRGKFADEGVVACSTIEYSTFSKGNDKTPPSYTNGIDILAGRGWVIRDNTFRRIRSEKGPAGPAILTWRNSQDTVIKRNKIVDCWRGIALGLGHPNKRSRGGSTVRYDHQDGLVENNVIVALQEVADAAIENNFAHNSQILHNTIFYATHLKHRVNWAIEYRYGPTSATIQNNLSNLPIRERIPKPQHLAVLGGNMTNAKSHWFQDLAGGDVHLVAAAPAIDQGVTFAKTHRDFDDTQRPLGQAPDPGADEWQERITQPHVNNP